MKHFSIAFSRDTNQLSTKAARSFNDGRDPLLFRGPAHLRNKARFIGLVAILAAATSGCISAEVEIPEVQVTRQNLCFPGVPPEVPTSVPPNTPPEVLAQLGITELGDVELPVQTFSYDEQPVDLPEGLTSDMHVKSVTVAAHEGTQSLSFVRRLRFTLTRPGQAAAEATVLLEYPPVGSSSAALIEKSLTIPVQGLDDVVDPWKPQPGIYELRIWGDLATVPREPWAVDVTLSFTGTVLYKY
jgi:hypothetical protein